MKQKEIFVADIGCPKALFVTCATKAAKGVVGTPRFLVSILKGEV